MKVRHTLSALVTAALLLGATTSSRAEDAMDQARKRYAVGEREYASGRYWQSAKAFEEAYDLSRKGDLLFNAARAYDRGEYYVRAIETYEASTVATTASRSAPATASGPKSSSLCPASATSSSRL